MEPILLAAAMMVSVYDGDTLKVDGVPYRMVGYDAPEIHGKCDFEKSIASVAKLRLITYTRAPTATLIPVKCVGSNFGRLCGKLIVNGKDIAPQMIEDGLGHPYNCKGKSCPKRLTWCSTTKK